MPALQQSPTNLDHLGEKNGPLYCEMWTNLTQKISGYIEDFVIPCSNETNTPPSLTARFCLCLSTIYILEMIIQEFCVFEMGIIKFIQYMQMLKFSQYIFW